MGRARERPAHRVVAVAMNVLVTAGVGPLGFRARLVVRGGLMMERETPKKVVVSKAAVRRAGARAIKASAKLEGRIVPAGHRRSAAVKAYLAKQQPPTR